MRFRCLLNFSALANLSSLFTVCTLLLAVLAIPAFHANSQAITQHRRSPQFSSNPRGLQHQVQNRLQPGQTASPATTSTATPTFGGFQAAQYTSTGSPITTALVTADFNQDGKPDVATINYMGEIEVLLNDSHGSFKAPVITQPAPWYKNMTPGDVTVAIAADMNGDGYPDIILGESQNNAFTTNVLLAVRLNQKDGTFGSPTVLTLPIQFPPQFPSEFCSSITRTSFVAMQSTSSGRTDIVAAEECLAGNNYSVLLQTFVNGGDGNFTAKPVEAITPPSDVFPTDYAGKIALAFADVNHDGKQDLLLVREFAVSNNLNQYVDILPGNGDGTFRQPTAGSTVLFSSPIEDNGDFTGAFSVQSLTGDAAKQDLIINLGNSVYVALSNGDGTFKTPAKALPLQEGIQLLFGDLNNDGKLDLIASGYGSLISYLGNGDGTFGAAVGNSSAYGRINLSTAVNTVVADFNGDGKLDFANGDNYGHVELGVGSGDGTFDATPLLSSKSPVLSPYDLNVLNAGDFNGDGQPDLLAVSYTSTSTGLTVGLSNATGGFTYIENPVEISGYFGGYIPTAIGDFNGDGKQDVLLISYDMTYTIALSNGDGTFKTPMNKFALTPTPGCDSYFDAVTGDINGDGKTDIVMTYTGDSNQCSLTNTVPSGYFTALGNGDGTFQSTHFYPVGTSGAYLPVLARFHGQNKPLDFVFYYVTAPNTYRQVLLPGKGDGTFGDPQTIANHNAPMILADDFNQDGIPDLTMITQDITEDGTFEDGAFLYAGNGDGTFQPPTNIGQGVLNNTAVYADVNGDGIPDLVGNGYTGLLAVYLGTGNGAFAASSQYFFSAGNAGSPLYVGKFLGDNTESILDITGDGTGTAFFMNQGGTRFTVSPSTTSVTTGGAITISSTLTATLANQPAPTGSITYFDGTTNLGSASIGQPLGGVQLAQGTHQITANYQGDTHFNPNTSAGVTVTVTAPPPPPAPDFTFTSSAAALDIAKGSTGSLTFNVAANSTLSGTVTFQCTGLPSESTCAFSPSSLTVAANGSGSSTLTIGTKAASAVRRQTVADSSRLPLSSIAIAGLLVFFIPRRKLYRMMMIVVLCLAALTTLNGCGGGGTSTTPISPSDPGTPLGTTSVTVTATGVSGSTTISHTIVISLKVQ